MADKVSTCIPAVELRHWLDPLDTDDGPLQRLAPHTDGAVAGATAGTTPETAHTAVSRVVGVPADVGYQVAV